jgi:TatA/E family protein of Tat protein translocase
MFGIGPIEFAVVLVVALLVMGPKKLPELARTLGKGLSEFRRASSDLKRSFDMDLDSHEIKSPPGPAQTGSPHVAPTPGSALEELERRVAAPEAEEPLPKKLPTHEDPGPSVAPLAEDEPVPAAKQETETPGD